MPGKKNRLVTVHGHKRLDVVRRIRLPSGELYPPLEAEACRTLTAYLYNWKNCCLSFKTKQAFKSHCDNSETHKQILAQKSVVLANSALAVVPHVTVNAIKVVEVSCILLLVFEFVFSCII